MTSARLLLTAAVVLVAVGADAGKAVDKARNSLGSFDTEIDSHGLGEAKTPSVAIVPERLVIRAPKAAEFRAADVKGAAVLAFSYVINEELQSRRGSWPDETESLYRKMNAGAFEGMVNAAGLERSLARFSQVLPARRDGSDQSDRDLFILRFFHVKMLPAEGLIGYGIDISDETIEWLNGHFAEFAAKVQLPMKGPFLAKKAGCASINDAVERDLRKYGNIDGSVYDDDGTATTPARCVSALQINMPLYNPMPHCPFHSMVQWVTPAGFAEDSDRSFEEMADEVKIGQHSLGDMWNTFAESFKYVAATNLKARIHGTHMNRDEFMRTNPLNPESDALDEGFVSATIPAAIAEKISAHCAQEDQYEVAGHLRFNPTTAGGEMTVTRVTITQKGTDMDLMGGGGVASFGENYRDPDRATLFAADYHTHPCHEGRLLHPPSEMDIQAGISDIASDARAYRTHMVFTPEGAWSWQPTPALLRILRHGCANVRGPDGNVQPLCIRKSLIASAGDELTRDEKLEGFLLIFKEATQFMRVALGGASRDDKGPSSHWNNPGNHCYLPQLSIKEYVRVMASFGIDVTFTPRGTSSIPVKIWARDDGEQAAAEEWMLDGEEKSAKVVYRRIDGAGDVIESKELGGDYFRPGGDFDKPKPNGLRPGPWMLRKNQFG